MKPVEKILSIYSCLILIVFFTGTVRAVEPDQKDDFAIYGIRQVRITHSCDPAIPSPQTQAAADAIPCATTQIFIVPPETTSTGSKAISWLNPVTRNTTWLIETTLVSTSWT